MPDARFGHAGLQALGYAAHGLDPHVGHKGAEVHEGREVVGAAHVLSARAGDVVKVRVVRPPLGVERGDVAVEVRQPLAVAGLAVLGEADLVALVAAGEGRLVLDVDREDAELAQG